MSLLLIMFVVLAANNPSRLALAAPTGRFPAARAIGGAAAVLVAMSVVLAWISGPLIDRFDISRPSSMIAAGIAVLVIGTRDAIVSPPVSRTDGGWARSIIFPIFFPTMFTPGLALTAVAAGAERGVVLATLAISAGIFVSGGVGVTIAASPRLMESRIRRLLASSFGLWAVAGGVLLTVRGVRSI